MMKQELAETRALALLAWLAGTGDLLETFMAATGAEAADLRARAGEGEFLASVVDFLMSDDAWVIRAAEGTGMPAGEMAAIRAALPGGLLPDWT